MRLLRVRCARARNDPEKMVLPGVIFCGKGDDQLYVFVIAFGWWDYHVSFIFAAGGQLHD